MYFIALHQLVVFEYFVYFISSLYISTLIMLIVICQSHIFLGFMLYLQFSKTQAARHGDVKIVCTIIMHCFLHASHKFT